MSWISIENVQFFAYHGVYEEEQIVGNDFVVDVHIEVKLDGNSMTDKLNNTLNYETIFHCCKKVMRQPKQLLETVANDIVNALKSQFAEMQSIKVKVKKLNPLPGEQVGSSSVQIEENFSVKCPSCGKKFSCYKDNSCWCFDQELSQDSKMALKEKFKGCLCPRCISQYAG